MSLKNNYELSDFLIISPEKWKEKILHELKANSAEALQWRNNELTIQGFYTNNDLQNLSYLDHFHSHFILKSPRHWYTREIIEVKNVADANSNAKSVLNKGADAIAFDINIHQLSEQDFLLLLKDLPLKFSPIHFITKSSPMGLAKTMLQHKLYELKGSFIYLPIAGWLEKKNFSEIDLDEITSTIKILKEIPRYKAIHIDASNFHQKEIGIIKEIAYALSLSLEFIDKLTDKGLTMEEVLTNFEFSFTIGKNFFLEIAKLRAFRLIWKKISEACDPKFNSLTTPLHCNTSMHQFSKEDPYQNIFHNTTEAMAAVIGGCDSLSIVPFDKNTKEASEFSSRISRNISLILKEESYFDKITDPAAGSYYLENLTNDIAQKAWAIITQIEGEGGFVNEMKKRNFEF